MSRVIRSITPPLSTIGHFNELAMSNQSLNYDGDLPTLSYPEPLWDSFGTFIVPATCCCP
jgi:hypothetical protein